MLARETERSAARDEYVEVRCPVEKRRHICRSAREMLEVVEEEQRAGACQHLRCAVDERPGAFAHAQNVRDGCRNEVGVRHRREADEVNRSLERGECRDFECEPALSRTAGTDDRDEPHVRPAEQ